MGGSQEFDNRFWLLEALLLDCVSHGCFCLQQCCNTGSDGYIGADPATPQPSPTPTPEPLLFQDDFDGMLDASWQWMREDNKYWSLTDNPGWLEIVSGSGSVNADNIKNLLLRQAPDGNFELETRLTYKPKGNYQIAGLIIYESAANHIQFGRAFCNAPQPLCAVMDITSI